MVANFYPESICCPGFSSGVKSMGMNGRPNKWVIAHPNTCSKEEVEE